MEKASVQEGAPDFGPELHLWRDERVLLRCTHRTPHTAISYSPHVSQLWICPILCDNFESHQFHADEAEPHMLYFDDFRLWSDNFRAHGLIQVCKIIISRYPFRLRATEHSHRSCHMLMQHAVSQLAWHFTASSKASMKLII